MPTIKVKSKKRDDVTVTVIVQMSGEQLGNNCGTKVVSGVHAYGESLRVGEWDFKDTKAISVLPTLGEIYDALDSNEFTKFSDYTIVMSDRVGSSNIEENANIINDVNDLEKEVAFRTCDFAAYLIKRKIGVVYSGPIVGNPNHSNNTAVQVWIWIPNAKQIVSDVAPKVALIGTDVPISPKRWSSRMLESVKKSAAALLSASGEQQS